MNERRTFAITDEPTHRHGQVPAAKGQSSPGRALFALALLGLVMFFGSAALASPGETPISPADLAARIGAPNAPVIVDVRTPGEFQAGHLAGAINIAHDEVENRWQATGSERDDEVILYCGTGRRARLAQQTLETMGYYHTRVLEGGVEAWKKAGLPLVTESAAVPAAQP